MHTLDYANKVLAATILVILVFAMQNFGLQNAYAITTISVNPTSGFPNSILTITGTGFNAGPGYVWFDTNKNVFLDPGEPNQFVTPVGGSFTTTLQVPNVNPADYGHSRIFVRADFTPIGNPIGSDLDANAAFTVNAPSLISINDVSSSEGNSGSVNFVFTVSSNPPPSITTTVNFATQDGTATVADNDYDSNFGTITLTPSTPTQSITIRVIGDTKIENDETFYVNLSDASNAVISDSQGVGTIMNDDTISNTSPSVDAGSDQNITLPDSASLTGTVTDDGLPIGSILSTSWSKVNGPGTVTFLEPNSVSTVVSFSSPGVYTLRLTANDSQLSSSDDITITVNQDPPQTSDSDSDGIPDNYDQCPSDPNKALPGTQGCGNSETAPLERQIINLNQQISDLQLDSDQDGVPDLFDQCPSDPLKIIGGVNGCGAVEPDFEQVILTLQGTISNLNSQILQLQNEVDASNPSFCGIPQNSWSVVIRGTPGNDKLFGTKNNDLILGYDGNNKIFGLGGDDCIIVGDGNNIIISGRGDDTIITGNGNNRIHGGNGDNYIETGNGNDLIFVGGGDDHIDAGGGLNKCVEGAGDNDVTNCQKDKKMKEENYIADAEENEYVDRADDHEKSFKNKLEEFLTKGRR